MTIRDKLALMREIERRNTEALRKAGLLRKKGTEVRHYEESA